MKTDPGSNRFRAKAKKAAEKTNRKFGLLDVCPGSERVVPYKAIKSSGVNMSSQCEFCERKVQVLFFGEMFRFVRHGSKEEASG